MLATLLIKVSLYCASPRYPLEEQSSTLKPLPHVWTRMLLKLEKPLALGSMSKGNFEEQMSDLRQRHGPKLTVTVIEGPVAVWT